MFSNFASFAFTVCAIVSMLCSPGPPNASPTTGPATRPDAAVAEPVAAVWHEPGRGWPKLIVGMWSDGTVVWSADRVQGGKPYQIANVGADRVKQLSKDLDRVGLLSVASQARFGPDASHTVIAAEVGEKKQWLGSWHDPAPRGPNVVVDEHGMRVLQPGEGPPKHSAEYQKFLDVWSASRKLIEGIVPESGEPMDEVDQRIYLLGR